MKALIVYLSFHHKNTEKIAKVFSKVLNAQIIDLLKFRDVSKLNIFDYDLIGFGSGIYFGKHHRKLLEFVDSLPINKMKVFIFSTCGINFKLFNHYAIRKKLKQKHFEILGEFSCKGYDTYGFLKLIGGINKNHPNEEDIRRAEEFAKKLKEMFN
ncbi:MAG: flavodoxin family protein [Candidatus Woesearchaeota archaeon]